MASTSTHCQWCSAINCSNSRLKRSDLKFHRFPKDPERSKRWVINCRREDLMNLSTGKLFYSNVLCSEHFERTCYGPSGKYLKKTAIPTLFNVPNPPPSLTPKRPPPKVRIIDVSPTPESPPQQLPLPLHHPRSSTKKTKTPAELVLKRQLNTHRCQLYRYKKKLDLSSATAKTPADPSLKPAAESQEALLENAYKALSPLLSGSALDFTISQLRVSNLPSRSRRWTHADKSLALSIFHTSKKCYQLLRQMFKLPSPKTLTNSMRNLNIAPGFSQSIMELFSIKVGAMRDSDRVCSLIFDEVSLKSEIRYNQKDDVVDGYEDYGFLGRTQSVANYALVFMVRGLQSKWKQPFAYFLSKGPVKSGMLITLVHEAIQQLTENGLMVKVIVCDQGSNNQSLFKQLGVSPEMPYFHTAQGQTIFALYDPPHLLKSIRNNFLTHGFLIDGKNISWSHVWAFYEKDIQSPIRLAPKLTKKHLNPPNFAKQKVSLAAQVMSHTVASGLATMATFGLIPQEATATGLFVEKMDQLFNAFNSRSIKSKNRMGHAITTHSNHLQFLEETRIWLASIRCQNKSGSLPCLTGWLLSIQGLVGLWKHLQDEHKFKFLLTNRLNQDCIENLFSVVRGKGGHRTNPSPSEFKVALRQSMIASFIATSDRTNCRQDLDKFLFSQKSIISRGDNKTVKSKLQQDVPRHLQSIVRAPPPALSLTEDNVIQYIAGYIISKLSPRLCESCICLLQGNLDSSDPTKTFTANKNFDNCVHGLYAASDLFFTVCQEMELIFRDCAPKALHTVGIRNHVVRQLAKATHCQALLCSDGKCDLMLSVVCLYANIRVHHHIKCINVELQSCKKTSEKKVAILQHM